MRHRAVKERMKKYLSVWCTLAKLAFLVQCTSFLGSLGWLGGKVIRLVFFLIFLSAIYKHVPSVAGYTIAEVAFFFLTFNLVDNIIQLFIRGIYNIGRDIREGDLDFYLLQPIQPLFRISSNYVDFLDLLTLIPVLILMGMVLPKVTAGVAGTMFAKRFALYILLCLNGMLISFAIHVLIAAVTVRTQQMENTIWLYRDFISLGRFPVDIYQESIRLGLTYALPIAVMVSFPAKAMLGQLTIFQVFFAFVMSATLLNVSLLAWKAALRHYSSVSS